MSTSDDSDVVERTKQREREEEILDDDVTLISNNDPYEQLKIIVLRLVLAIIFLGLGVGAIVYSVYNSEKDSDNMNIDNKTSDYRFNIEINQACERGTFILESFINTTDQADTTERKTIEFGSSWIQDNDHKRFYIRIGLTAEDWIFTDYVHSTFTVRLTKDNCTKNYGVTYEKYLNNLGLAHLRRSNREESVAMHRSGYQPVTLYSGPPGANVLVHGVHPAVVFAYTNPENGVMYGFEMYLPYASQSPIFRLSFWYANMTNRLPDPGIFYDYPDECEQQLAATNATNDDDVYFLDEIWKTISGT